MTASLIGSALVVGACGIDKNSSATVSSEVNSQPSKASTVSAASAAQQDDGMLVNQKLFDQMAKKADGTYDFSKMKLGTDGHWYVPSPIYDQDEDGLGVLK